MSWSLAWRWAMAVPWMDQGTGMHRMSTSLRGPDCWSCSPPQIDHAVTANEDEDDRRVSLAYDLALTAPLSDSPGQAPPEYLAPHPQQWSEVGAP